MDYFGNDISNPIIEINTNQTINDTDITTNITIIDETSIINIKNQTIINQTTNIAINK